MPISPIAVLMCERVLKDVLREDALTLVNIHSTMSVQAFPAVVPLVFTYAEVTGSNKEFTYQFKFVDQGQQVMAASSVQTVRPQSDQQLSHKLIGAFQGLIFPNEGNYDILLSINGEDVAGMTFQIWKVNPPAQA